MKRPNRSVLLIGSATLVVLMLGGGLALRVGASDPAYRQAVRFAEVLSLVEENYVDPVEAEGLLRGAYEGMLGGLDPNGAFLTPAEVARWKADPGPGTAAPGVEVLKAGRVLHVVAVEDGSPAAEAGIEVGDQLRSIDGEVTRDLSLLQARHRLRGAAGSSVRLEFIDVSDGFERHEVSLERQAPALRPYRLDVSRGTAVLTIRDLTRIDGDELAAELDDARSRGVERLLLDLRDFADGNPRDIAPVARLFADGPLLKLRDRSGRLVESVDIEPGPRWAGSVDALVNGASAGAAEALAAVVRAVPGGRVFGESTYGLGAEPGLYELENGYGLLLSSSLWETEQGEQWNANGVEPDEVVHGEGDDVKRARADQLSRVLDLLDQQGGAKGEPPLTEAA